MKTARPLVILLGFALTPGGCAGEAPDPSALTRLEAGQAALYVASHRLWPGPIPVCWESLDAQDATGRAWVRDAVETTWQRASGARFTGWGACAAGARGVRIRVAEVGPHTLGLGTEIDGVKDGMALNFTFTTWSPGCQDTREFCVRAGAIHEFGHALGFAHEQNRPDTPSSCTSEQGSPGDVLIGPWDLDSIMNYCNPRWTGDGKLSAADIQGARAAYGSGGGDWFVAPASGQAFGGAGGGDLHAQAGRGASRTLLADVTGDGRADAVAFFDNGEWWVAPATSTGAFAGYTRWGSGHGAGSTTQLLADVTGDRRADAVVVFKATGNWWVAPSTGSSFAAYTRWQAGHGAGAAHLLADVTGDGRADAVAVFKATGSWWVAPSTGSSFAAYTKWKTDHGADATAHLLGDVNGDGRADAVAFFDSGGAFWVAPSTGASFSTYARWRAGFAAGASAVLLADVTGDRRADAVAFTARSGAFAVAPAQAGAFAAPTTWRGGLGQSLNAAAVTPLLGDVNGDGRADAAVFFQR